jgi:U3 small nucleolar RNA-associated protein 7
MFAAAQKKYVYIYDNTGLEIHRLQNHTYVDRLDFLPYHFLLASIGSNGYLKYQDTSTGSLVAERRTKFGACNVMTHNPYNAVIHLGHNNGVVSLWSPSMPHPLVKMQCHRGAVRAVAVDKGGHYMATSGSDGKLKVWDIRTYGVLQEYFTPRTAVSLDISDKGLLAVGWNTHAQIWKDCFKTKQSAPYMSHIEHGSAVESLKFVPFEDVLGIGHEKGISSIVVPGAGEANFDSLEANPYQNKKQRQETEVHSLLDKLQPDMIVLDPSTIGKLTRLSKDQIRQKRQDDKDDQEPETPEKERKRMRGRNSALKRHLRKKAKNIVDHKLVSCLSIEYDGMYVCTYHDELVGCGREIPGRKGTGSEGTKSKQAIYNTGHFRKIDLIINNNKKTVISLEGHIQRKKKKKKRE